MANDPTITKGAHSIINGNVILVEPNDININNNFVDGVPFVNGVPQYQDMFIFAELIAESKGRSVISLNTNNVKIESDNGVKINMMGMNQDNVSNNPDYLNFTTNYYDGSMGNKDVLESFGITSIKITVNSSYVPQVTIQFVDIRGLSFFNTKNSPYRILFDFPPPIFTLTVKGYYGKALTYKLHLVKYTTEFQAENGNFVINADFVAMTFAPLSDILFRYIVNVPLITNNASMNPEAKNPPTTTNELIIKLKNLYSDIDKQFKKQPISQDYDSVLKQLTEIDNTIEILNRFNEDDGLKSNSNTVYLIVQFVEPIAPNVKQVPATQPNQNSDYQSIGSLNQFDEMLKKQSTSGIETNSNMRLLIGYIGATNILPSNLGDINRINKLKDALNSYRNKLIIPSSIKNIKIPEANINNYNKFNIESKTYISTRYVTLDITDYYTKLYNTKNNLNKQKTNLVLDINNSVNQIVIKDLGMIPTVYNIFKIILNDVDTFFDTLRDTSNLAEFNHNRITDKNIITNNNQDVNGKHIFPFPLIIRTTSTTHERIAPIEIQKRGADFPELTLVQKFIDSFQSQKNINALLSMRTEQNDDGSYKWIPVSPFDSTLGNASPTSPYFGNIDSSSDNLSQIYQTLLRRYYILSQGTFPYQFSEDTIVSNAYIELYANSEAINLAASLAAVPNPKLNGLLKTSANNYSQNLTRFYNYLTTMPNENGINLYNFPDNSVTEFPITPTDNTNGLVYTNKNNINFIGLNLYPSEIKEREEITDTENSSNIIDNFIANSAGKWYQKIFYGIPPEYYSKFTQENIMYIEDVYYKDDIYDGLAFGTRYLGRFFEISGEYSTYIKALAGGNLILSSQKQNFPANNLNLNESIVNVWTNILYRHDTEIFNDIINTQSHLSALVLLSSFGYAYGPFNLVNGLNELIFSKTAVVEVPTYLPLYIGALIDAIEGDGSTAPWVNDVNNFFAIGNGKNIQERGVFIAADIHDIQLYLSANDKAIFKNAFISYYNNPEGYSTLSSEVIKLYNEAHSGVTHFIYKDLETAYDILLNPNSTNSPSSPPGHFFETILKSLMIRTNIIIYSQITFRMDTAYNTGYISLATTKNNSILKKINDKFFSTFFIKLNGEILAINDNAKKEKDKQDKIKGDIDIITQTYYSFKNINDKWLTSPIGTVKGYPYNDAGKKLIDSFAFVDRAMNPIGDTIINAELLPQLFEDTNVSVFSVLSQLLSANGFEFFPLQNFMSFADSKGWEDSFKITTSIPTLNTSSAFVCMYIGGSSSYPSTSSSETNGFVNDGIINLINPGVPDFNSITGNTKQEQEINNSKFPYRQVRAFRVRFGEQNQSMFTNIKIDSKEYTDTNESINILARLAGDNKIDAPTPKGQNLYNLYENRSYKATITSMGNATIQPTQYFQIENVPLFDGAYIILSVEHTITANKMMTEFSGVKILKYPLPRVLNPVAFVGIDEDISNLSAGQIVQGALLTKLPQTEYNSMYRLKIS
jgi:hypothetical protein